MSDNNLDEDRSGEMEIQEDGLSNIEQGQLNHAGTQKSNHIVPGGGGRHSPRFCQISQELDEIKRHCGVVCKDSRFSYVDPPQQSNHVFSSLNSLCRS